MKQKFPARLCLAAISVSLLFGGCAKMQSVWSGTQYFSKSAAKSVAGLLRPAPKQREVFTAQTQSLPAEISQPDIAGFMRQYGRHDLDAAYLMDDQIPVPTASRLMASRQTAMIQTREAGVKVYRPGYTYASVNSVPAAPEKLTPKRLAPQQFTPRRLPPANLRPASSPYGSTTTARMINGPAIGLAGAARPAKPVKAEAVSNLTDTSFVKIGGKSQMTDWQACESGAGGVFVPADTALGYSVSAKFETCMRGKGYVPESEAIAQFEQSAAL